MLAALYVGLLLLVSLPGVKAWMASKAADELSAAIGSKTSIDNITVNLFNSASAEGVVIYDQSNKKMLEVERMDLSLNLFSLLNGTLDITSIKILKAKACLYKESPESSANYQFMVDSLMPKPGMEKGMEVNLSSLLVNDLSVTYDVYGTPKSNGLVDANHLDIEKFNTSIIIKSLKQNEFAGRVRNMYVRLRDGLELSGMHAIVNQIDDGKALQVLLKNLSVAIPGMKSDITDSRLVMTLDKAAQGNGANSFLKSLASLELNGTADISGKGYKVNLSAENKTRDYLRPLRINARVGDGLRQMLSASIASSYDMKDNAELKLEADVTRQEVVSLLAPFGINLPSDPLIDSIDRLVHKGTVDIHNERIKVTGSTSSNLFSVIEDIDAKGRNIDYALDIEKLDIPASVAGNSLLLSNASLAGTLSTDVPILSLHESPKAASDIMRMLYDADAVMTAKIGKVTADNTSLAQIESHIRYSHQALNMELGIADPKVRLHSLVTADNVLSSPRGHLTGKIEELQASLIDPSARYTISASLDAALADLHNFDIDVKQLKITNHYGKVHEVGDVRLQCKDEARAQRYSIASDYVNGDLTTDIELLALADVFKNNMAACFPSWKLQTREVRPDKGNASFKFLIDDPVLLSDILDVNINSAKPVNVYGQLNATPMLSRITVSAPEFSINGERYENASIYINSQSDSLKGSLMATKFFNEFPVRIESHFAGGADLLTNELIWKDQSNNNNTSGRLCTETEFSRTAGNELALSTRILPADFYISDTLWQISPATIRYSKNNVKVNDLKIFRNNQYVNVNADIDNSKRDIMMDINDIEVAYILSMTNLKPVEFSGKASGIIRSLYDSDNIKAKLKVTDFCFNKGEMGELNLNGIYDFDSGRINVDAKTQASPEDSTLINGYICLKDKTLDLRMKSEKTNLQFLNRYLGRFICDLEGNTSGDFRLFGDLKYVNMEGNHRINYLQLRPKMLGVLYTFENDSVHLRPDTIDLSGMTLRDPYGNTARIRGSVNHSFLFKINYNFDFLLDKLQVLNWVEDPSRPFWGEVHTSGNISLNGNLSNVRIGGELTTDGGPGSSVLYYNSETAGGSEEKNYISFVTPYQKYSSQSTATETELSQIKDKSADIHMNFKFNTNPDATLNIITDPKTKDFMSLNGNGSIRMSYYNKGKFELNGLYSISGGNYKLTIKDIIRKNFAIQPGGYLRFNGNPSDGDLNIKGIHKISSVSMSDLNVGASHSNSTIGVDCILNFTGKASDPKVSFDLDFPNANSDENQIIKNIILTEEDKNMQVVYLLSIGRFYTYNYDTFNSNGQSQSSVAMTSFLAGTLSGQINTLLQDAFHINNWNFGTNIAAGRQGFNDMEVQGSLSGKMFNNRLLFNGNFGYRDQITTYSNNFVGDFNLQWLLNKAGTISLKAYSETNDRYFAKSSLTTQGGGILFQKDFNLFRDFFRKKKPIVTPW